MASTEKIAIPSLIQTMSSKFFCLIKLKARERYVKKISAIRIDPVLIGGKRFEPDGLPSVESTHLLCYFVFSTSYYAQKCLP